MCCGKHPYLRALGQSICPAYQRRKRPHNCRRYLFRTRREQVNQPHPSAAKRNTPSCHRARLGQQLHVNDHGALLPQRYRTQKGKWIPKTSFREYWTMDGRKSIAHLICSVEARVVAGYGQFLEFNASLSRQLCKRRQFVVRWTWKL